MRKIPIEYKFAFGKPYLLPLVDLILLGRERRVYISAVVDSGAVMSVFPAQAAADAGIELPAAPNFAVQYGGSTVLARRTSVALEMASFRWTLDVAFVERLELPYALLGRAGVFSQFNEVAFLERVKAPRIEFRD